jgi:NDP-sugar pyrophosphorylase family protein
MAGDMLIDLDLPALVDRHRASGRDVTLVLRRDRREGEFGSVGVDAVGRICRIGRHSLAETARKDADLAQASTRRTPGAANDPGIEQGCGLFTSVRFFEREAIGDWPPVAVFEDLRDWLMPRAAHGEIALGAEIVDERDSVWEPVGTPAEYLEVNIRPPALPSLGGPASAWQGPIHILGAKGDVIADRSVRIPGDARLERCVVWDDACLPAGARGREGVYGRLGFHPVRTESDASQRGAA